jgi:predicted nucleic acid-binding protein
MRVLLDNDVTLDYVLKRPPAAVEAKEIFERLKRGEIDVFIAPITPVNVFYIVRKLKGKDSAFQAIKDLFKAVKVCTINKGLMQAALKSNFTDYEDAVQHACAEAENLDAIVTRNISDYKNAVLPVYSPAQFLNLLKTP